MGTFVVFSRLQRERLLFRIVIIHAAEPFFQRFYLTLEVEQDSDMEIEKFSSHQSVLVAAQICG